MSKYLNKLYNHNGPKKKSNKQEELKSEENNNSKLGKQVEEGKSSPPEFSLLGFYVVS